MYEKIMIVGLLGIFARSC